MNVIKKDLANLSLMFLIFLIWWLWFDALKHLSDEPTVQTWDWDVDDRTSKLQFSTI